MLDMLYEEDFKIITTFKGLRDCNYPHQEAKKPHPYSSE